MASTRNSFFGAEDMRASIAKPRMEWGSMLPFFRLPCSRPSGKKAAQEEIPVRPLNHQSVLLLVGSVGFRFRLGLWFRLARGGGVCFPLATRLSLGDQPPPPAPRPGHGLSPPQNNWNPCGAQRTRA